MKSPHVMGIGSTFFIFLFCPPFHCKGASQTDPDTDTVRAYAVLAVFSTKLQNRTLKYMSAQLNAIKGEEPGQYKARSLQPVMCKDCCH
jgi:hypothetical protein